MRIYNSILIAISFVLFQGCAAYKITEIPLNGQTLGKETIVKDSLISNKNNIVALKAIRVTGSPFLTTRISLSKTNLTGNKMPLIVAVKNNTSSNLDFAIKNISASLFNERTEKVTELEVFNDNHVNDGYLSAKVVSLSRGVYKTIGQNFEEGLDPEKLIASLFISYLNLDYTHFQDQIIRPGRSGGGLIMVQWSDLVEEPHKLIFVVTLNGEMHRFTFALVDVE